MEVHKVGYTFFKIILGPLYRFWYNPKIIGKENIPLDGRIIVCGNHLHIMDQCALIVSTKRMLHYLAKKEYFDGKFAWFFKMSGCIPVNRQIKDNNAKNTALELLNQDCAIGLFPEGTRNRTNKKLLPFKYGAVSLAIKTDSYIVPFGISGTYKFRSKDLMIRIGKPFKVTDMSYEDANKLLTQKISLLIDSK